MTEDMLEKLKTIDLAILTEVVRQDQNSPSFEITDWSVKRLSNKGIDNPDGLWLLSGYGYDHIGSQPWSIVVKIFQRPKREPAIDDLWYWKREFIWAQSDLSRNVPGPIRAPNYYRTEETPDGVWLWMEYVADRYPGQWTLDNYVFAAHQLGLWNSAYLTNRLLPDEPWLTRQHYRAWLAWRDGDAERTFPLNQKYIRAETWQRYDDLYNEREKFYRVLESLPQVFSHFDCQRRNLMIGSSNNDREELIVIDWQQCGIGAIGAELNWLMGMSCALLEWSASEITRLDKAAFKSYVQGLREGGWSGSEDIVRLGYTTMTAVYLGCIFPSYALVWCSSESREFASQIFGRAEEDLFLTAFPIFDYALDCADEARLLLKKLGM